MEKVGDIIQIIFEDEEPHCNGKIGVVEFIDDITQIDGSWGECALVPGLIKREKVED